MTRPVAAGAALLTASAAGHALHSSTHQQGFLCCFPCLPPELAFAKAGCSNDANPISLPAPLSSSRSCLFAGLGWRCPVQFLLSLAAGMGMKGLLEAPALPAAAWGCVVCGWVYSECRAVPGQLSARHHLCVCLAQLLGSSSMWEAGVVSRLSRVFIQGAPISPGAGRDGGIPALGRNFHLQITQKSPVHFIFNP